MASACAATAAAATELNLDVLLYLARLSTPGSSYRYASMSNSGANTVGDHLKQSLDERISKSKHFRARNGSFAWFSLARSVYALMYNRPNTAGEHMIATSSCVTMRRKRCWM